MNLAVIVIGEGNKWASLMRFFEDRIALSVLFVADIRLLTTRVWDSCSSPSLMASLLFLMLVHFQSHLLPLCFRSFFLRVIDPWSKALAVLRVVFIIIIVINLLLYQFLILFIYLMKFEKEEIDRGLSSWSMTALLRRLSEHPWWTVTLKSPFIGQNVGILMNSGPEFSSPPNYFRFSHLHKRG